MVDFWDSQNGDILVPVCVQLPYFTFYILVGWIFQSLSKNVQFNISLILWHNHSGFHTQIK